MLTNTAVMEQELVHTTMALRDECDQEKRAVLVNVIKVKSAARDRMQACALECPLLGEAGA